MSTLTLSENEVQSRLWTIADLVVLPDQLPTGPVRYQLEWGVLSLMAPPGESHGAYESNLITELKLQGERKGFGKVRSNTGVILQRDPDTVFAPDILFVSTQSLPIRCSSEGYLETIPELIVEIRSKNDTLAELERKADRYLQAGCRVIWVVDPVSRSVREYRTQQPTKIIPEEESLEIPDLIAGFKLAVSEIFVG